MQFTALLCRYQSTSLPQTLFLQKSCNSITPRAEYTGFAGVDEVAWIKDFKPKKQYDFSRPLIVIRPLEERAVYTKDKTNLLQLAKKLTKLGNVIYLSRYSRKSFNGLTVPNEFVDSASLTAQADLFIGVGGTITREAALQGVPAIVVKVFSKQYVNDFLIKKGFPIFETDAANLFGLAQRLVGKRYEVRNALNELENPVNVISSIVRKVHKG